MKKVYEDDVKIIYSDDYQTRTEYVEGDCMTELINGRRLFENIRNGLFFDEEESEVV